MLRKEVELKLITTLDALPLWIIESIVNEFQNKGYKYKEPIFKFSWIPNQLFDSICKTLASIGVLGKTYVYNMYGYNNLEELYINEKIIFSEKIEIHYWYKEDIVD